MHTQTKREVSHTVMDVDVHTAMRWGSRQLQEECSIAAGHIGIDARTHRATHSTVRLHNSTAHQLHILKTCPP
jgi:hypothetical protein